MCCHTAAAVNFYSAVECRLFKNGHDADAAAAYASALEDLTFNSKPVINSLTMIAEESARDVGAVAAIVSTIEETLRSRPPDKKLPVMYLLDSISKNVKGKFAEHFAHNLRPR